MRFMLVDGAGAGAAPVVQTILDGFIAYHTAFKEITCRARRRFEECDWHGLHQDALERLDLYGAWVDRTVAAVKRDSGDGAVAPAWTAVKDAYAAVIAGWNDVDFAQSFYNSVTMRVVVKSGLDPTIEFVGTEVPAVVPAAGDSLYRSYPGQDSTPAMVRQILRDCEFAVPFADLDRDAAAIAAQIDAAMQGGDSGRRIEAVEVVRPIFYRGKGGYLVGRMRTASTYVPLVLALFNDAQGVYVDAALLTEDEVSIVFSFTRWYFHVDVEQPAALVRFLKSIMPRKRVAELYISLGYNKHGKTELYRDLRRHLAQSTDQFQIARGERGMVMVVFTLPSYDVVFKIIKDSFDYPKRTTRRQVMNHYQLVFKHDRGGRLVDAQEFEHLWFERTRFAPELLAELLQVAGSAVAVEGDAVVIKHLYTERRLTPLNLYLHEVDAEPAHETVIDYGQAIKDLAATNIFPGDILLKNFGVTRHGRVVFYDYDELCLLTDCNFRLMPQGRDSEEEMSAEPWFSVGENDVFPEELATFLGLPHDLRAVFARAHGELFGVDYWAAMKERHLRGEVLDVLPYKETRRLQE